MSKGQNTTYLRVGPRRIPMIEYRKTPQGDEYMFFRLGGDGFHLTKHPHANPHIKDNRGFRQELDLTSLRRIDFDAYADRLQTRLESCAYWPSSWRSIIAFPGPPGKTWWDGLADLARGSEFDMIQFLRVFFGGGTIYRITHRQRRAFFSTDMGKKSGIFDRKERCWSFYASMFPEKPLIRLNGPNGLTSGLLPPELQEWKEAMNYRLAVSVEENPSHYIKELAGVFENEDDEATRELKEFFDNFRIVRWRPGV